jgi:hypothetical protein
MPNNMTHRIVARSLLAFCCSIPLALCAIAQQEAPAPGQEKMQQLSQVLNLSPQQQSQLGPIVQAEKPKIQAIMQDPNLSPSEKKSKLQHVHSQTDPLVKSILNPTQYKQWQTIRNAELENMHMK